LKLKFQTVAEKTAKNFRGLLYFAAPGRLVLMASSMFVSYTMNTLLNAQCDNQAFVSRILYTEVEI